MVAILSPLMVHLHILCDLIGSRGLDPGRFLADFLLRPVSQGSHLDLARAMAAGCLARSSNYRLSSCLCTLWLAVTRGYSFVGVFSRRLDQVFVAVLRKWYASLMAWRKPLDPVRIDK